jgi:LmbE family N-acetylglucosaminyl deacetylase
MQQTILIVAAHPDDEVLGCGATIPKLSRTSDVFIVFLGEGLVARYRNREEINQAELDAHRDKSIRVAELLGAEEPFYFSFPDNSFDAVPLIEIVKQVEEVVAEVKPDVIYTHHPGDLNIDHHITFRAVLTATRPVEGFVVKEIYSFEVPSSTEWSFQRLGGTFSPNVFVDVSNTIDLKVEALRIYDTEIRSFPHPRSAEALRAIAARWGSVVGLQFAEAFELVRSIRR